jgi:hypothetical protein
MICLFLFLFEVTFVRQKHLKRYVAAKVPHSLYAKCVASSRSCLHNARVIQSNLTPIPHAFIRQDAYASNNPNNSYNPNNLNNPNIPNSHNNPKHPTLITQIT